MDVLRWEFVLVAFFNHLGHVREVLADGGGVLLYDQVVVTDYVLQEARVIWQVLQKWLKLLAILFVF